ncbi:MAG TPA: CFI-box-CTERM domain-containing protein [Pyrinomonadaceae bacterium]|nr:CFI-box-CTERM domain-containing protein [Pyrinomonadaceae bacterium]
MATPIVVTSGSLGYTAPSFNYGATTQAINGGYSFDLPLATVAAFTNNAMAFAERNTANAQGFFSGVFSNAQAGVNAQAASAFKYQDKSLEALQQMQQRALDVQKYGIKKQYSTKNLLKPGSQCFITTAICKAAGLPDDTWQLMRLRTFRDEHLLTTDIGKALVAVYYQIAPVIVAALDASPLGASHYAYLAAHFIYPALQQISVGNHDGATATYSAMVETAAKFAGLESLPVVVDLPPASVTCTCRGGKRAAKFHAKTCPVRASE